MKQKGTLGDWQREKWIRRLSGRGFLRLILFLILSSSTQADGESCEGYEEIRRSGHMSVGVRFDVPNIVIQQQFGRAMDFWAGVVDMEWRDDQTEGCAIKVRYGTPDLFDADDFAQADDPDSSSFRGEIAFNSAFDVTPQQAYLVSIHEIGHLLGLDHNPSPTSVMYAVEVEGAERLDLADIAALSARHQMLPENGMEIHSTSSSPAATETGSAIETARVSSPR